MAGYERSLKTVASDKKRSQMRITPLKAIRQRCINCCGFELKVVRECDCVDCALFSLRMGRGARATLKRIKTYCFWCCNNQRAEVRKCSSNECPLWPYRFGRRPKITLLLPEIASTTGDIKRTKKKEVSH
jgi:hypothetical protein